MPLGRIKIIRRNGTSDFSDNSDISVSEYMGTVAAPLVSLLVTRPNSKKIYQNNRNQGWATRVTHNCFQPPTLMLLTVWFGSRLSSGLMSTVNTVHFQPFELDVDGREWLWAALMSQSLTVSEGYRFCQVESYRFPKVTVFGRKLPFISRKLPFWIFVKYKLMDEVTVSR